MSDISKKTQGSAQSRSGETAFDGKPLPDKIGTSLKSLYDEVLNEAVPDDFLNLLKQADDAGQAPKDRASK